MAKPCFSFDLKGLLKTVSSMAIVLLCISIAVGIVQVAVLMGPRYPDGIWPRQPLHRYYLHIRVSDLLVGVTALIGAGLSLSTIASTTTLWCFDRISGRKVLYIFGIHLTLIALASLAFFSWDGIF